MEKTLYSIKHVTEFNYSQLVKESLMEVRLHPIQDEFQQVHSFNLFTKPEATINSYKDNFGNIVHHFNMPGAVNKIRVVSQSQVEILKSSKPLLDNLSITWEVFDSEVSNESESVWDMLQESKFARSTPRLNQMMLECDIKRLSTVTDTVLDIYSKVFEYFEYKPNSTNVYSEIDEVLEMRKGVCQDYSHVMIAILRELKIPARYVSGYLYQQVEEHDQSLDGASHAWVEVFFPTIGWIGFDPTNNKLAEFRHIRLAVGSDYNSVPPTKGIYKGEGDSELLVSVSVNRVNSLLEVEEFEIPVRNEEKKVIRNLRVVQQQQQQQ